MTKDFPEKTNLQTKEPSPEEIAAYNDYIGNMILDTAKNQVILDYIIEQLGQEEFENRLDKAFKVILEDYKTQGQKRSNEFFGKEEEPTNKITLK